MDVTFWKVEAAGNDFILVDNRSKIFRNDLADRAIRLTNRRLGIGADGLILIENHPGADFFMNYWNADGSGPVMCGNGSRASLFFVHESGISRKTDYRFVASDGAHLGKIENGQVSLTINQPGAVQEISLNDEKIYLVNTGVPHLVRFMENIDFLDIYKESPGLRKLYNANINYLEKIAESRWKIRTYERGVEDETLACGTGATASAITINKMMGELFPIRLQAPGGELCIDVWDEQFWLSGPVQKVYEGIISI